MNLVHISWDLPPVVIGNTYLSTGEIKSNKFSVGFLYKRNPNITISNHKSCLDCWHQSSYKILLIGFGRCIRFWHQYSWVIRDISWGEVFKREWWWGRVWWFWVDGVDVGYGRLLFVAWHFVLLPYVTEEADPEGSEGGGEDANADVSHFVSHGLMPLGLATRRRQEGQHTGDETNGHHKQGKLKWEMVSYTVGSCFNSDWSNSYFCM